MIRRCRKMLNCVIKGERLVSRQGSCAWKMSSQQLNAFPVDVDRSPLQHNFAFQIASLDHQLALHVLRFPQFLIENRHGIVNGPNLSNERELRLVPAVLHSRTLVPIVEARLRDFHRKIHVLNGDVELLDLNLGVGETSQALKDGN